jgi:diacylglycerol kinase family enzyme
VKLLLVVNSKASAVTSRTRVVIGKALSADHDVTLAETSRRGHATRLAQGAADTADAVVVLGGDGTVNEAANGLAGSSCALAVLPGGSTNVFARTIGLPNDPVEATGALLDALARRSIRRIGLGTVDGRYFLFHTGVGFDAEVVSRVERRSDLKRYAGHPLFVYTALDTWLRHYDRRTPAFEVGFPDGTSAANGYLTIVLNTSPYTYLGNQPLDLAPEADFDSGLTAVTLQTLRFGRTMPIIVSALRSGRKLRRSRWVDFHPDLPGLELRPHRPVPYQVDGDLAGTAQPGEQLEFRHVPDILDLVLP